MPKTLPKNLSYHNPVLLQVACDFLNVLPGKKYIDATYGGGGHTAEIRKRGGLVLTIDQDPDAGADIQDNFRNLTEIAKDWRPVSGILFDLGVSMHQFADSQRGFSIEENGPLDMRMNQQGISAAEILNTWPVEQLTKIFVDFGEIPTAKTIAEKIVRSRPLSETQELVGLTGKWARQVFQSLRITVNDELSAITETLPQALEILEPGGRVLVISFHSLEDRLVKNQFKTWQEEELGKILTPKPIAGEKKSKLRAFQKQ